MNAQTHELIRICQRLPEAEQLEVLDFARQLLNKGQGDLGNNIIERWLTTARGAAKQGASTNQIMVLTRGEP